MIEWVAPEWNPKSHLATPVFEVGILPDRKTIVNSPHKASLEIFNLCALNGKHILPIFYVTCSLQILMTHGVAHGLASRQKATTNNSFQLQHTVEKTTSASLQNVAQQLIIYLALNLFKAWESCTGMKDSMNHSCKL